MRCKLLETIKPKLLGVESFKELQGVDKITCIESIMFISHDWGLLTERAQQRVYSESVFHQGTPNTMCFSLPLLPRPCLGRMSQILRITCLCVCACVRASERASKWARERECMCGIRGQLFRIHFLFLPRGFQGPKAGHRTCSLQAVLPDEPPYMTNLQYHGSHISLSQYVDRHLHIPHCWNEKSNQIVANYPPSIKTHDQCRMELKHLPPGSWISPLSDSANPISTFRLFSHQSDSLPIDPHFLLFPVPMLSWWTKLQICFRMFLLGTRATT